MGDAGRTSRYVLSDGFLPLESSISRLRCSSISAYERQAHSARLRQELSKSRAEQSEYLRNVELARVLEKRKAKKQAQGGDQQGQAQTPKPNSSAQRVYKQKNLVGKDRSSSNGGGGRQDGGKGDVMAGVLDSLF